MVTNEPMKLKIFIHFQHYLNKFDAWPGQYGGQHSLKGTRPLISLALTFAALIPNIIIGLQRLNNPETLVLLIIDCLLFVHCVTYVVSFSFIYVNISDIEEISVLLENFSSYGSPRNLLKIQRRIPFIFTTTYWGSALVFLVFFCMKQLSKDELCMTINKIYNDNMMCGLFVPLHWFKGQNTFLKVLLNSLECFTVWRVTNISLLGAGMMMIACEAITERFELLKHQIRKINFRKRSANDDLKKSAQLYSNTIRLFKKSIVLSQIPLLSKWNFIIVTALAVVAYLKKPSFYSAVYMLSWTFGILIPCYVGQRIIDKSTNISLELYKTNWYTADLPTRKILSIFLNISQTPCAVSLGLFGRQSNKDMKEAFSKLYVFLTFLWKVIK